MTEKSALTSFQSFLKNIKDDTNPKDRVFLAAGILELLRRTKSMNTVLALGQFLVELPEVNWSSIPFSLTKTAMSADTCKMLKQIPGVTDDDVPDILLESLTIFLDFVQNNAELSPEIFSAILQSVADDKVAKHKNAHKVGPEIFNERLVARAFTPVTADEHTLQKLNASLVLFRGELPGAKLGPDIRGLAFDTAVQPAPILLETGELVRAAKNSFTVAAANTPEDFKTIPTSLLLSASLASVELFMMGAITEEQSTFLNTGGLGRPAQELHSVVAALDDLQALEHVFGKGRDSASMRVTGPTGATVRFPVPDTDMTVVIDARHSEQGPYSVSRLVRIVNGEDVVIMRNDTPRLFTSRGVYIFPTKDSGLVSLTAIR